jgi:prepilin-type processing-associated H-X9-DG protein
MAGRSRLSLFICPSDAQSGQVVGSAYFGTNYAACNGTGVTFDASGAIAAYLKIPDGNGVFAQVPTPIGAIIDGTSNTAAFSESLIGNGLPLTFPSDPQTIRLAILKVAGGNDPTPSDCDGGNGTWYTRRGEQWINGHYGHTLYNHFYTPNQRGKWDCGNASGNKGLTAARSYHPGGVNLLLCDASVRFIVDGTLQPIPDLLCRSALVKRRCFARLPARPASLVAASLCLVGICMPLVVQIRAAHGAGPRQTAVRLFDLTDWCGEPSKDAHCAGTSFADGDSQKYQNPCKPA